MEEEPHGEVKRCLSHLDHSNNHLNRILSIIINASLLGCGIWYTKEESCILQVLLYLRMAGGVGLLINFIELILLFYVHGGGSRLKLDNDNLEPFSCFVAMCNLIGTSANISLLVWGSIIVFIPFIQIWNKEPDPFEYCQYVPYLLAVVMITIGWALLFIRILRFGFAVSRCCCNIYWENDKPSVELLNNTSIYPSIVINSSHQPTKHETSEVIYEELI